MLGEGPDQAIPAQNKGEGFNDRRLAAVVRADQNRMIAELNLAALDPAKILYL